MSNARPDVLDPITLEILFNALRSVTDESYIALMKSAYSTNIKERHDHSTAIMDADGRLVVQAENSLPIHLASMTGLMNSLLARHPREAIREGDIFVANDPHAAGGTHLPDINMAMPMFADGRLMCFVCNIAHHADVGGIAPGSMAGGMSEIYQEGLRIPVVRLFAGGELQQDLFDLVLLNVRLPEERRGDYYAQTAACRTAERRVREIAGRYGADTIEAAFDEIIGRTERRMRERIREIPDGTYRFEDVMDDDGLGAFDIPIRLRIDVEGDRIHFDFAGTAPQVRGNINLTTNATQSAICILAQVDARPRDPEQPRGARGVRALDRAGHAGRLPLPGAGRGARTHLPAHRRRDRRRARRGAPRRGGRRRQRREHHRGVLRHRPGDGKGYLYLETLGGGFGGRATKDGTDGVQVHITNTSNLPVEAIEMEYPLRVERYELLPDSGGAGRFRGGLGLRRVIRPIGHACTFNGAGERFRHRPWGIFGAGDGASGRFVHRHADGAQETLGIKPSGVEVGPDETIEVDTPGAGGYGAPGERAAAALAEDLASGKFTREYLERCYGAEAVAAASSGRT